MCIQNKLVEISSLPDNKQKILAVHGLGLYGKVFQDFKDLLSKQETQVNFFDLVGFGSLQKEKFVSFQDWISQVKKEWGQLTKTTEENTKFYLLGHSLGGIIAVNAIRELEPQPTGLILSVPAFGGNPKKFPFFKFIIPTLFKYFNYFSEDRVENLVKFGFSEDTKDFLDQADPKRELSINQINSHFFIEISKLNFLAWKSLLKLKKINLLMLLSKEDQVCLSKLSSLFFNLSNSENKTKKVFDLSHDLFALKERKEVYQSIFQWLKEN